MRKIKVGDTVSYMPWGAKKANKARVLTIEICKQGTKYGREVDSCNLDTNAEVVLDLDDNHWCYKHQIVKINS